MDLKTRRRIERYCAGCVAFVCLMVCVPQATWAAEYSVGLTVTAEKLGTPGEIVTHVFTLANQGSQNDGYNLEVNLPEGWTVFGVPTTVFVSAGEYEILFANLAIPETAEAREYQVVLQATSTSMATVSAQATARIEVAAVTDFAVAWEKLLDRARPGGRTKARIQVRNLGNTPDTYRVELRSQPEWEIRTDGHEVFLLPGQIATIEFSVQVPASAEAGTRYTVEIVIGSKREPSLLQSLRVSHTLGPPPPETVGGTLFPEWEVGCRLVIDETMDPMLTLTGSGDIPSIGELYVKLRLATEGVESAHARWVRSGWGLTLGSGAITGAFLGINGWPLFLIGPDNSEAWARLLFTDSAKGFSGHWACEAYGLRIMSISDTTEGFSVAEIQARYNFDDVSYVRCLLSNGQDQTGSATAFQGSGRFSLGGLVVDGFCAEVPPGYPKQAPRSSWSISGNYNGCPFPMGVRYSWTQSTLGSEPDTFLLIKRGLRATASVISRQEFFLVLDGSVDVAKSTDTPASTNEFSHSLSGSLASVIAPFSCGTRLGLTRTHDYLTGITSFSKTVEASAEVSLSGVQAGIRFCLERKEATPHSADRWDLTCLLGLPDFINWEGVTATPEITLSLDEAGSMLGVSVSGAAPYLAWFEWKTEASLSGECRWSTSVSVSFTGFFPFCGPIRGRVSGYLFIDSNENGLRDSAEPGLENVLLSTRGHEAITNSDGLYVFRPLMAGVHTVEIDALPMGFELMGASPIRVSVRGGEELRLDIPVRRQARLSGFVFDDANRDGQRNAGEGGIGGVGVAISGKGTTLTLRTNNVGQFGLNVVPGVYSVNILPATLPDRYELTTATRVEAVASERSSPSILFGANRPSRTVVVTFGPPTAAFSISPARPSVGSPLVVDASASRAVNAEIVRCEWEIAADGLRIATSGRTTEIVPRSSGTYRVRLVVTDSRGLKAASEKTIEVRP